MSAANKGNVEVMVQLSQKGADVNAKDKVRIDIQYMLAPCIGLLYCVSSN